MIPLPLLALAGLALLVSTTLPARARERFGPRDEARPAPAATAPAPSRPDRPTGHPGSRPGGSGTPSGTRPSGHQGSRPSGQQGSRPGWTGAPSGSRPSGNQGPRPTDRQPDWQGFPSGSRPSDHPSGWQGYPSPGNPGPRPGWQGTPPGHPGPRPGWQGTPSPGHPGTRPGWQGPPRPTGSRPGPSGSRPPHGSTTHVHLAPGYLGSTWRTPVFHRYYDQRYYCPPARLTVLRPGFLFRFGFFTVRPWWQSPLSPYVVAPTVRTAYADLASTEQERLLQAVSDFMASGMADGSFLLADPELGGQVWRLQPAQAPSLYVMDDDHYTVVGAFQGSLGATPGASGVDLQFFVSRPDRGARWQVDAVRIMSANGLVRAHVAPPPGYPQQPQGY